MKERFYITTPIYYVNAKPHLGHAYTTIVADVMTRFHKMKGESTFFLTGTDEHGDKVVRAAAKAGMSPRQYVDHISSLFRELWPRLDIENDRFIRTTDPAHQAVVQQVLKKIYDQGDIYFSEYEGLYCFGCERFYTERELIDGKCPDHETEPELLRESNYFFRMSRYQDWLIGHVTKNPDFIRPERYRNEVLAFLKEPLEDLCISRPKSRLTWGITLPFDDRYVTYVWFDALLNYVSALGYPDGKDFLDFWPHAQHVVAKDILKPHGIYWPIMLKAAGIPVYRHLNVHGYWNVDRSKMSKSLGNVIEPLDLINIYGLDAFRFFLMREMAFGLDSSFSQKALVHRLNSDLANDLGNLFSRVLAMVSKYSGGKIPPYDKDSLLPAEHELQEKASQVVAEYTKEMEGFHFHKGLATAWELVGHMNRYVDYNAPWELAKKPEEKKHLENVLYHLCECLRIVAGLVHPVMPKTSRVMCEHLGGDPKEFFNINALFSFGLIKPGTSIKKGISLFPRVDPGRGKASRKTTEKTKKAEDLISMDLLSKIRLVVGTVLSARKIPKAEKLLELKVDIGEDRTIVAGLAKDYTAEELVGKQVIVVANLSPAKLMGVVSQGMVLAAVDGEKTSIITTDREVKPGTTVR